MNIKQFSVALFAATVFCVTSMAQSLSPSTKTHWDKGTLVVDTPTRPAGQQHVLGLTAPKLETVRKRELLRFIKKEIPSIKSYFMKEKKCFHFDMPVRMETEEDIER